MLFVSDFADGRMAREEDQSGFAGRQSHLRVFSLFRHQLSAHSSGANKLSAFAEMQLDVVNDGSNRDRSDWQTVSRADIRCIARDDDVALFEIFRSENISLLAIRILDKRDSTRSVGIVLYRQNCGGNIVFVSFEIDDTIHSFVAAACEPVRDSSLVVSSAGLLDRFQKRFMRVDRLSLALFFG